MKIYEIHNILKDARKFTFNGHSYSAIFFTGSFEGNFDYGAGILEIIIYPNVISICNIDDGVWQASGDINAEKVIKIFEEFDGILPTEETLNSKLATIGLWGEFTG